MQAMPIIVKPELYPGSPTELVLKLECHKVMQNYLPALSYLRMACPQAAFTHLK